MKRRLVILTEIISPYRIPLFNELARSSCVDAHIIFLAENDPGLRQWRVYKDEIRFSYQVLPSWRLRLGARNLLLNARLRRSLAAAAPDAILCGGYNYVSSWQALLWAKTCNVPFFLWSESNTQDMRRAHPLIEFLKDEFLARCTGFVVPGQSARGYLRLRRIKDGVIFTAPNAVDNDLFTAAAADARTHEASRRHEMNLPARYFLFTGRLVKEKGVYELLSAYAKLDARVRDQIGMVFAGEGVERLRLEQQAAGISPGRVSFPGFVHREELASYYALAEMLILPTWSEPWGLVVNEAMACGLPVIVSEVAGCAPDLLRDNWNGVRIPVRDVPLLAAAMEKIAADAELRSRMGGNSRRLIAEFSAKRWCEGIVRAMSSLVGTHD